MSSDLFLFAQNHVAVGGRGCNPQALLALITGREAVNGCCLLESEGRFGSSPAAPARLRLLQQSQIPYLRAFALSSVCSSLPR